LVLSTFRCRVHDNDRLRRIIVEKKWLVLTFTYVQLHRLLSDVNRSEWQRTILDPPPPPQHSQATYIPLSE
jgi:hypothetical protein